MIQLNYNLSPRNTPLAKPRIPLTMVRLFSK